MYITNDVVEQNIPRASLSFTVSGKNSTTIRNRIRTVVERYLLKTGTSHYEGPISAVQGRELMVELQAILAGDLGGAILKNFVLTITETGRTILSFVVPNQDEKDE